MQPAGGVSKFAEQSDKAVQVFLEEGKRVKTTKKAEGTPLDGALRNDAWKVKDLDNACDKELVDALLSSLPQTFALDEAALIQSLIDEEESHTQRLALTTEAKSMV